MRRALLVGPLLACVMAFGSMPAHAGVSGDITIEVGRGGPVFCEGEPRGYWQGSSGYVCPDGRWNNDRGQWNGVRVYRSGGRYRGSRYGGAWYVRRARDRQWNDGDDAQWDNGDRQCPDRGRRYCGDSSCGNGWSRRDHSGRGEDNGRWNDGDDEGDN